MGEARENKVKKKYRMYSTLLSGDLYDVDCRETVTHKKKMYKQHIGKMKQFTREAPECECRTRLCETCAAATTTTKLRRQRQQ